MPTVEVEPGMRTCTRARRRSSLNDVATPSSTSVSRFPRPRRTATAAAVASPTAPVIFVLLLLLLLPMPKLPSSPAVATALSVPCPQSCRAARCCLDGSAAARSRPSRRIVDDRGGRGNHEAAAAASETVMARLCHRPASAAMAVATASLPLETADLDAALEEQLGGGGLRVVTLCGSRIMEERDRDGDESSSTNWANWGRPLLVVGASVALVAAGAGVALAASSAGSGGGVLGGGGVAAGVLPWLLGRGGECMVDGRGGTLSFSVLLASVREMVLAASKNSKSIGQFVAEELLPSAVETLRKMLLMEFWRRVWTAVWGATRRVWRERATLFGPSSSSFSCGEYLPALVCRAGEFVSTTVRSGSRRLFQKGVERRVQGFAVEWWSYGWSSVGPRMAGLTAAYWSWSDASSASPESPVVVLATSN